jgi:hypothetical protein
VTGARGAKGAQRRCGTGRGTLSNQLDCVSTGNLEGDISTLTYN